jgi:hypothetical protein
MHPAPSSIMVEEEKFCCKACDKQFSTAKILKRHMLESHPVSTDETLEFVCQECGKNFKRNSNLQRHISSVHGKLGADQAVVDETKSHHCQHCDAKFRQKCHLKEHMLIHSGARYHCNICDKHFSRIHTLRVHLATCHDMPHLDITENKDAASASVSYNGEGRELHHHSEACKKIAYMSHKDHVDFLLACGSIFCNEEERLLPEGPLEKGEAASPSCASHMKCRHKECTTTTTTATNSSSCSSSSRNPPGTEDPIDSTCDHFKRAHLVKHGDHYDVAFNGFLWNSTDGEEKNGSAALYVSHGPLLLNDINDGVEGFLEFVQKDINLSP